MFISLVKSNIRFLTIEHITNVYSILHFSTFLKSNLSVPSSGCVTILSRINLDFCCYARVSLICSLCFVALKSIKLGRNIFQRAMCDDFFFSMNDSFLNIYLLLRKSCTIACCESMICHGVYVVLCIQNF